MEKYVVASDSWVKQAVTSSTELLVNDLEEGREYEFRVFAVNEVGESEPLSTAKAIVAKNQYSEYAICNYYSASINVFVL